MPAPHSGSCKRDGCTKVNSTAVWGSRLRWICSRSGSCGVLIGVHRQKPRSPPETMNPQIFAMPDILSMITLIEIAERVRPGTPEVHGTTARKLHGNTGNYVAVAVPASCRLPVCVPPMGWVTHTALRDRQTQAPARKAREIPPLASRARTDMTCSRGNQGLSSRTDPHLEARITEIAVMSCIPKHCSLYPVHKRWQLHARKILHEDSPSPLRLWWHLLAEAQEVFNSS